ncbi:hypothetical protein [Nostoc sp. WHI]|uniref:hypothetical protein n=1 Tax=Nostoc sp. WHI TaxID=2650611 RepID=UPI0018C55C6D|nr:hypothetical protein [Nostoc sp. WHI]MBG1267757.1 hypothetical protein [Nostoc sp. WHI]
MTNILTETNRLNIVAHVQKTFNRSQATGLNCLIFLALREQTTVKYQHEEWGFDDISEQIVTSCDQFDDDELIALAADIATGLLEELVADQQKGDRSQPSPQLKLQQNIK